MKALIHFFNLAAFLCVLGTGAALAAPPATVGTVVNQDKEKGATVAPPKIPTGSEDKLKTVISVTAVNQPLTAVLQTLSVSSATALKTPSYVGVQRVTLCVKDRPLYQVMRRIVETLSHQVDAPNHYFWDAASDNGTTVYTLRPAVSAAADLRANLAEPRQQATQILIDDRTIAQLPPSERKKYKSSNSALFYDRVDMNVHAQALKALSDSQFAAFLRTGVATVRAGKLHDLLAAAATPGQEKLPYPTDVPSATQIPLRLYSVGERDQNYNFPNYADPVLADFYGYQLGNNNSNYIYLNGSEDEATGIGLLDETPRKNEKQPIYDLTKFFDEKAAPFSQRISMAYALSALSQATGATVYEEHFQRGAPVGSFGSNIVNTDPPRDLQGTLPQLVNRLCKHWQYRVVQADNGDLVFWSRRWGRDKQADIAETTLEPWRRTWKEKGFFTEFDYRDMMTKLSYAQIKITLPLALFFSDEEVFKDFMNEWQQRRYMARRIDSLLTPLEREAALSPDGIRLADVAARQTILREVRFRSDAQLAAERAGETVPALTENQILQSRIFLPKIKREEVGQPVIQRVAGLPYDPTRLIIKSDIGLRW